MTIKHSLHFGLQGGPIFDLLKQTNKNKTKAYKLDQNLNTKNIKNIYLIKSKNFKINMKRLKMKTKRRKENRITKK